jgi:hypothetical protein
MFLPKYLTQNWPRGLRRGSAASWLLELRFRIPPGAWILSDVNLLRCQVKMSAKERKMMRKGCVLSKEK